MTEEKDGPKPEEGFLDVVADDFMRLRDKIYVGVEWLVKYCELILLAGAFTYGAHKTNDPTITILASALGLAAMFYAVEFTLFVTKDIKLYPKKRVWWRWLITLVLLALFSLMAYRAAENVSKAIESFASGNAMVGA